LLTQLDASHRPRYECATAETAEWVGDNAGADGCEVDVLECPVSLEPICVATRLSDGFVYEWSTVVQLLRTAHERDEVLRSPLTRAHIPPEGILC
jgi:hypothetical protein